MATIVELILAQSLDLGYAEIEKYNPTWEKPMVDDYLYKQSNINSLASTTDQVNTQVALNTAQIQVNLGDIIQLDIELTDHEALATAHGVTGDNIGTEDYAQALTGGSVLLAGNVVNANSSSVSVDSPNAPAAAVAYSQVDTDANVTLTNELKSDVNQLKADLNAAIVQLNLFLAANKTAKQMAP